MSVLCVIFKTLKLKVFKDIIKDKLKILLLLSVDGNHAISWNCFSCFVACSTMEFKSEMWPSSFSAFNR